MCVADVGLAPCACRGGLGLQGPRCPRDAEGHVTFSPSPGTVSFCTCGDPSHVCEGAWPRGRWALCSFSSPCCRFRFCLLILCTLSGFTEGFWPVCWWTRSSFLSPACDNHVLDVVRSQAGLLSPETSWSVRASSSLWLSQGPPQGRPLTSFNLFFWYFSLCV